MRYRADRSNCIPASSKNCHCNGGKHKTSWGTRNNGGGINSRVKSLKEQTYLGMSSLAAILTRNAQVSNTSVAALPQTACLLATLDEPNKLNI